MPEWLAVTGAISAVALAAGVVSGPSLKAAYEPVPLPVSVPTTSAPVAPAKIPKPADVPVTLPKPPAVQPPSAPAVRPPALPTAPVRPHPVPPDEPPTGQTPYLPPTTETTDSVTPTTSEPPGPCPVGLVLDPVLGVCVSL